MGAAFYPGKVTCDGRKDDDFCERFFLQPRSKMIYVGVGNSDSRLKTLFPSGDFYEEGFESTLEKLPKDKTYLVYCHSGGRSGKTLNKMNDLGFEHVYHLEEGYADWKEKGGAIEK